MVDNSAVPAAGPSNSRPASPRAVPPDSAVAAAPANVTPPPNTLSGPSTAAAPSQSAAEAGRAAPRFAFQEDHWPWKLGFRVITVICAIIGAGTLIWAGTEAGKAFWTEGSYRAGSSWAAALSIPLFMSIIFNFICILRLFVSKRPVHPGVAVGFDLVLWLSLLCTGFWGLFAYYDTGAYNAETFDNWYGSSDSSYRSSYYCGSSDYVYDPYDRTCTYTPQECSGWSSCETRTAFYRAKHMARVILAGAIFTWICTLLHFILFVWACVDTHRRNRSKGERTAKHAAERIVQEMVATGQLVRPVPAVVRGTRQGPTVERPMPPVQEFYSPAAQQSREV